LSLNADWKGDQLKDIPSAILWDLDGTIVNSKACHFYTWHYALEKQGITLEKSVFDKNFGRNNPTLLPLFLGFQPDADLGAEIINDKETLFREIAQQQVELIPGVETWLLSADGMNIAQAIASSAPMENITVLLNIFNLDQYFDLKVSGVDLPTKPAPDIFLQTASGLEFQPRECLVVEDSVSGVQAAKSAGMKCVAVTTSHSREELTLADLVVDDFQESIEVAFEALNWGE